MGDSQEFIGLLADFIAFPCDRLIRDDLAVHWRIKANVILDILPQPTPPRHRQATKPLLQAVV